MLVCSGDHHIAAKDLIRVFLCLTNHSHRRQYGNGLVQLQSNFQHDAAASGLHGNNSLIGLDIKKGFSVFDGISHIFVPLNNGALVLGVAQLGHDNDFCHNHLPPMVKPVP